MKDSEQNGFTLIEVLVAMMVLAVSLVVVMELFSTGLRNIPAQDNHIQAVLHAREKMEELLLNSKLEEAEEEGDFDDGFRWQTSIREVAYPVNESLPENADRNIKAVKEEKEMFHMIEVAVFWTGNGREKKFTLFSQERVVK